MMSIRSGITEANVAACVGCNGAFLRVKPNQIRCRPDCGRQRDRSRDRRSTRQRNRARTAAREQPRRFIGIDGEGVTGPDGIHRYVLLSVGEHHLSLDGAHLTFTDVCEFLWASFLSDRKAVYVGFYLGYDFAQWLRTLPENRASMLLSAEGIAKRQRTAAEHLPPFPVEYEGWEFDYLPKKRFKLRKKGSKQWMFINDAGSYFQCTFLKACNPEGNPNPVLTAEEYQTLVRGKERRENAEFDAEMVEYNKLECDVLARLMTQLEAGMRQEELKLKADQWHGPGQLAQKWLRKINMGTGEQHRTAVPEAVREAARGSYYGGWFEPFWHGPVPGESFSYDINSAYPFVMSRLPCLLHGEWQHKEEKLTGRVLTRAQRGELLQGFTLVRAFVEGSHPLIGTMQHRNKNRSIIRPRQTEGWYWATELAAAIRAGCIDRIRVYEVWRYQPCGCPPPLGPIAELYEGRLQVGKNSPQGKSRKLIYNSCAGKFQQSIGKPVFGNPVYASAITSGCRELIADAIACHPTGAASLLMVATDGVVFRQRHTALELDPARLGAWTEDTHRNLSIFMSGVYWDDKSRARIAAGDAPAFKSRGVPAKDIAKRIEDIDEAWERFATAGWPSLSIPIHFQCVSPKQALARGKWDLCGAVISSDKPETWPKPDKQPVRTVSADPRLKRLARKPGPSRPYERPDPIQSLAYDGLFGEEMKLYQEDEFGDNPDGPIGEILAEIMLDN